MRNRRFLLFISKFAPLFIFVYLIVVVSYLNLSEEFDLSQFDRVSFFLQFLSVSVVMSVFLLPLALIFKGVLK